MTQDKLVIENAKLIFRNFAGTKTEFNTEGLRSFSVILEPDSAIELEEAGWNIRWTKPKNPDDDSIPFLSIAVAYNNVPPKIWIVTKQKKTALEEHTVKTLDWAEIASADIVVNPYHWEVAGKKGIKAYLKTMFVNVVEDQFADKYSDIPDGN